MRRGAADELGQIKKLKGLWFPGSLRPTLLCQLLDLNSLVKIKPSKKSAFDTDLDEKRRN